MPNVGFVRAEVTAQLAKWLKVEDCLENEEKIKSKKDLYLPKPETSSDSTQNEKSYLKYILRAVFYPVASRTMEGLLGQIFQKDIDTELSSDLEFLISDIDGAGTSLEQQAKKVVKDTIAFGRCGLLSDFPIVSSDKEVTRADVENGSIRPRVMVYQKDSIINWREQNIAGETLLSLLVLKEQIVSEDDGFEFEFEPRWRVYQRKEDGSVTVQLWKSKSKNDNGIEGSDYEEDGAEITLTDYNQQPLRRIPFEFIGAVNNDSVVDDSPLYPLCCLNIAHYRNSADYEQNLFLCGQATPVFAGLTDEWVKNHIDGKVTLGSANAVSLPQGATFDLLQAQPNSLPMEGMRHKEEQMKAIGAKLLEPGAMKGTATEAEIEANSDASILSSIAKNVSSAYVNAIFNCGLFIGDYPKDEITIALNSEFQVMGLNAQERQEVVAAWQGGLLTWEEARNVYRRKGIAYENDVDAQLKIDTANVQLNGE